ncbi:MAG: DUF3332 domain-containing protein [Leeuwenhoekiella sp.]
MKKLTISVALSACILCTSCLGSFSAVTGLKEWNDQVSDNKFVNNAVFWALTIIPVYQIFAFGDVVIFNLIEFWSGDNPIAMADGEMQRQIIDYKGASYEVIASKNKFEINVLKGENKGNTLEMIYLENEKSWNAVKDGELVKLASYEEGFQMVYLPNGEKVKIDPAKSILQNQQYVEYAAHNYKFAKYENVVVGN